MAAKRLVSGSAVAQPGQRSLLEQRVKARRRAARRFAATLHSAGATLVRRETRHEGGSAAFVEFVVDQRDKFGVIVRHDGLAQPSYFSFASAARPAASLLMIVPIGTLKRRGRLGVTVPFPVDQQDCLALRLGQPSDGS